MKWVLCIVIIAAFCLQACRNGDNNLSSATIPTAKGPSDSVSTELNSSLVPGSGVTGTGSNTGNSNTAADTAKKFAAPLIDTPFKKNP